MKREKEGEREREKRVRFIDELDRHTYLIEDAGIFVVLLLLLEAAEEVLIISTGSTAAVAVAVAVEESDRDRSGMDCDWITCYIARRNFERRGRTFAIMILLFLPSPSHRKVK